MLILAPDFGGQTDVCKANKANQILGILTYFRKYQQCYFATFQSTYIKNLVRYVFDDVYSVWHKA